MPYGGAGYVGSQMQQIEQKNIDEAHQAGVWNTNRKLEKMGKHRVFNLINNF